MSKLTAALTAGCAALLLARTAAALEVKLQVTETEKVGRTPATITVGVPFARGAARDVPRLSVSAGGKARAAQFLKLIPWDDGSVRWALMDVQVDVPAGGKVELTVSDSGTNPPPPSAVAIQDGAEALKVSTGPLQFVVNRKKSNLFESLKVDGRELVTSAGRGLVLVTAGGQELQAGPPTEVRLEQAQVWLENNGAVGYFHVKRNWVGTPSPNAEWFAFKGLAVELGLADGASAACEGVEGVGNLKVTQVCKTGAGRRPDGSSSHYSWDDFEYTVTSGGRELKKGARTDGVVQVKGRGPLTAAIRDFWQNYEKAIELDAGRLRFWLWPVGGQWPRPCPNMKYAQSLYDKTLESIPKAGMYVLPGSLHKGHEMILDFSGRDAAESLAELSAPLYALAPAAYYASTEAAPALFAPPEARTGHRICDIKLGAWDRMARSTVDPASPYSLHSARQTFAVAHIGAFVDNHYQFGWMDWGDVVVLGLGPTGLQFDWTWVMMLQAMRTGDVAFLRTGSQMARHRIDVDQLWSDRDIAECRGLERGGGGCSSSSTPKSNFSSFHCGNLWSPPGPGENWLVGVAAYYMLTGEPKALECCLRNAEGIRCSWDFFAKEKPYINPLQDMAANAWSLAAYCAAYDLTADRKWLDRAMALFNANVVPVWKKRGPFLHDPARQFRSQDYVKEDMRYCYAITAFCELHRRTGDAQVMKLLKEGCGRPFPESFFQAPLFLSDLYGYVGHRTGNPELVRKGAAAFARSFPASKNPPVYMPKNTTWSRTSATILRSGHLLQFASWKRNGR
ncbi:MAG: hypothetical protein ACYTGB_16935 [Planctomycetota bacterium]|jgi:hypothetical protein